MAFMPKYIEKKVLIWSDATIAGRTDRQTNEQTRKDRATQPIDIHAKSGRYLRYISAIFFGFSAKF